MAEEGRPAAAIASTGDADGGPLLCLSASGGGHFRQLLDLEPLWRGSRHFFVSENTALARSFAPSEQVEFVPHFALGQARLGKAFAMLGAALKSLFVSLLILLRRSPDVIITTGAGSQFFLIAWARLLRKKVVLIDSFARVKRPSKFARIAGRLAHIRIAQSEEAGRNWPGSLVFDPLQVEAAPPRAKEPLLFATVGAILPFDRLIDIVVKAKREGLIRERVILQVGRGAAPIEPFEGIEVHETLSYEQMLETLGRAKLVVCHGGTGSLITALDSQCQVIAIPRSVAKHDSYDDHQVEITDYLRERGLIEVAEDEESFRTALKLVRAHPPMKVKMDHARLVAHLRKVI